MIDYENIVLESRGYDESLAQARCVACQKIELVETLDEVIFFAESHVCQ